MSLLRGTSIVSSLTLVSRVLGLVREILVARLFGASPFADAYFVALRIPNLLRSIFAEGALTSAFVPVFTTELTASRARAQEALSSVLSLLLVTTLLISALGIWYSQEIVHLFAPGFAPDSERFMLCVTLTQIMFPYIVCVSVVALINGALNALKVFGASAWAQVIANVVLILGAYAAAWYEIRDAAITLAWSVIAGGILQVIAQLPALRRAGLRLVPGAGIFIGPCRSVVRLMIPAVLGAAVYQISIFLNTQLASVLEEGSVAWLSYADRLAQLPIGVFTIALASVLLPTLSRAEATHDQGEFTGRLVDALRFTSFAMLPVVAYLWVFAEPLISLLFERGNFDGEATRQTAFAVRMYAVGLWGVSCHSMMVRAFQAKHDTRTPVLIGIFSLLMTLLLSLLLMGAPYSEHSSFLFDRLLAMQRGVVSVLPHVDLGHGGLALASSLAFLLGFVLIAFIFEARFGGIRWEPFIEGTLRSVLASSVILLALYSLKQYVPGTPGLVWGSLCGPGLYILTAYLSGSREVRDMWAARSVLTRKAEQ